MAKAFPIHADVPVPNVLYKYRPWNEKTRMSLISGEIWFSSPNDFNDPFEFRFVAEIPKTEPELRLLIEKACDQDYPDDLEWERRVRINNLVQEALSYNGVSPVVDDRMRQGFSICCLSEIEDNSLMWSHYADSHRGVCIGISTERLSSLCSIAVVEYHDRMLRCSVGDSLLGRRNETILKVARTKSRDWEYEREWRLIRVRASNGLVKVPEAAIVSVTIGCQATVNTTTQVLDAVAELNHQVKLKLAVRNQEKYKLDIQPITD